MTEAAIRVENLTKSYGRQRAVDRLTLAVPHGAVFGLLGENGAGKTTTIGSLLGLVAPDEGWAEVLGINPARDPLEVRRRVGYVPEQPALYDWMTVDEIGWFAAGFHGHAPGGAAGYRARYRQVVAGYGLPLKQRLRGLSKGMRAEVSLALALASEPRLLILDEPTSGLDVLVRREFLESMVDLAGAGRTVLLSSHQIGEVERVASHIALLRQGHLLLAEPLDELKARTFTISLIFNGTPPEAPPPGLAVDLIDAQESARQARWLVHAAGPAACEAARALPGVEAVAVEPASLEDIYIGYMRRRRPAEPVGAVAGVA